MYYYVFTWIFHWKNGNVAFGCCKQYWWAVWISIRKNLFKFIEAMCNSNYFTRFCNFTYFVVIWAPRPGNRPEHKHHKGILPYLSHCILHHFINSQKIHNVLSYSIIRILIGSWCYLMIFGICPQRCPETPHFYLFSHIFRVIPLISIYFHTNVVKHAQNACIIKVFPTYFYILFH